MTYFDVSVASGHIEQTRVESDWSLGRIAYDENRQTVPPGVLTLRVKHLPTGEPASPMTGARLTVLPTSVCKAKPLVTCDGGACYGEVV